MATRTSTNDTDIIWMTRQMDLLDAQGNMMAHDKKERIVTILGMGILDRPESKDVLLDSCSLVKDEEQEEDDDDSSSEESDSNDSLELAKRRVRNDRVGCGRGRFYATTESLFRLVKQPPSPVDVAVKDTLELEYSQMMWTGFDDYEIDIKNKSSSRKSRVVATDGFSKCRPITCKNRAA
jgi:hypothetical protein